MEFQPHSTKQDAALFSDKRFTVVATGIQWGKSELGAVRTIMKMCEYTDPKDRFIITAPTFKIMDQATLPTFLERVTPLKIGQYKKGDREFQTKWGSSVLFRTGHIPDSVVGIRQTRHIWGDEAGLYSLYFWENLQGRAAPFQADITLTTSPYSLNWIFKELIKPALDDGRNDICLIQAASNENPYFPQEEFESRKKTMDPRRFQMMFGGRFERPEGMVYKCFDPGKNECTDDEVPRTLEYFAGIDWGYTEPFAMTVFGIDWVNETRYIIAEHKQSGMTLSDIKLLVEQTADQYQIRLFCCGPERPEMIDELCLIPGVRAIKGFNECRMGIDIVYDLMARGKIKFLKGRTKHHMDELESYHYPEHIESRPDKKILDQLPVQVNDHNMDSMRYAIATTIGMRHHQPFVPGAQREFGQSNYMRIKSMLNAKKHNYSGL